MSKKIILNKGRENSLRRMHPWIFSGAVKEADEEIIIGETVDVFSAEGEWLAKGSYSPHSQIRVRVLSFKQEEKIDELFFQRKIAKAVEYRKNILNLTNTDSFRILFSESDGLPGVIADKYADYIVCQFLTAGAEYWKGTIVQLLYDMFDVKGIFERSDSPSRSQEGLKRSVGVLAGKEPPSKIEINENGLKFLVDVRNGHKTGFYLDQSVNRQRVKEYSEGKTVLNCFSYTGGFAVYTLSANAKEVVNIDSSQGALDLCTENIELNGFDVSKTKNVKGDVFEELRKFHSEGRKFDLIILDPPKFVDSKKKIQKGARAYKDINLLAFKLLNENGTLISFSCSGHIGLDLFQKIIADAALDAGITAKFTEALRQSPDHPVGTNFPEAFYLKGFVCNV